MTWSGYSIYSVTWFAKYEQEIKSPLDIVAYDIADIFGIKISDLKGPSQIFIVAFCRQLFCYVVRQRMPLVSHKTIAKYLKYCDHTMSIKCVQKIRNLMDIGDPTFLNDWKKYLSQTKFYK